MSRSLTPVKVRSMNTKTSRGNYTTASQAYTSISTNETKLLAERRFEIHVAVLYFIHVFMHGVLNYVRKRLILCSAFRSPAHITVLNLIAQIIYGRE
jgi:hypothetical protein